MKEPTKTIERIKALGFTEPTEPQLRQNPYTGISHIIVPQAVMLYDFITTKQFVCGKDYTRTDWDKARYWFATQWSKEYYDLLD